MKYGDELGIKQKAEIQYPSIEIPGISVEDLLEKIADLQEQLLAVKPPEIQKVELNNPVEVQKVELTNQILPELQKVEIINPQVIPEIQKVELTNEKDIIFPETQKVEIINPTPIPEVQKVEIINPTEQKEVIFPETQKVSVSNQIPVGIGDNPKSADPEKYVPVRLTDGSKFYKALDQFYTAATGGQQKTKIQEVSPTDLTRNNGSLIINLNSSGDLDNVIETIDGVNYKLTVTYDNATRILMSEWVKI